MGFVIRERIPLPLDQVMIRFDLQRIRQHTATEVRCGPQTYHLRTELNRAVVYVTGDMMECDVSGHIRHDGREQSLLCLTRTARGFV